MALLATLAPLPLLESGAERSVSAASRPFAVDHLGHFDGIADMSSDGRWGVAERDGSHVRIDFGAGTSLAIPTGGKISDDGSTVWTFEGDRLRRMAAGGDSTFFPNPFDSQPLGAVWTHPFVSDVIGSTVILSASNGAFGTPPFTFDPGTGELERWFDPAGPQFPPDAHDGGWGWWTQSPDRQWTVFTTIDPAVAPTIPVGGKALVRRHEPSGMLHIVRTYADRNSDGSFGVLSNGGRLIIHGDAGIHASSADPPSIGNQLWTWSNPGSAPMQLTQGSGGQSPDGPIHPLSADNRLFVSHDGTRVTFLSNATNLDGNAGSGPHLYQAVLQSPFPNPNTIIAPSATVCAPVEGAEVGDFVGVNITPVNAASSGNGVLHSSDNPAGDSASSNFRPGSVDPNVAFAEVGTEGTVCFTNSRHGVVHVVLDQLVVAAGGAFQPPGPSGAARLADTRSTSASLAANETRCFGALGDPGDFAGVNVTPVEAIANGNGALHSSDQDPPSTANVNFSAGSVDPNLAFAQIGADGRICFTNSRHGPVQVILDQIVVGRQDLFSAPTADGAIRLVDSRTAIGMTRLEASDTQCVATAGAEPGDWVGVNATPVGATTNGFGVLHSSDVDAGSTANVNFRFGSVDPNFTFVEVGTDGTICFTNSRHGSVDLVLGQLIVAGAEALAAPTDSGAVRLVDTRIARP